MTILRLPVLPEYVNWIKGAVPVTERFPPEPDMMLALLPVNTIFPVVLNAKVWATVLDVL